MIEMAVAIGWAGLLYMFISVLHNIPIAVIWGLVGLLYIAWSIQHHDK